MSRARHIVSIGAYTRSVPKLWNDTIETHRREVREAILDSTWGLAVEHGPSAVRMSEVAEKAGIGRATLYKYFPDVEAILAAWHERQINHHLEVLAEVRDKIDDPGRRLRAVLEAYARIHRRRAQHQNRPHGGELASLLHTDARVAAAQRRMHDFIRDVLTDAIQAGCVHADATPDELASYCTFALTAASTLPSDAALRRVVAVTLAGLGSVEA